MNEPQYKRRPRYAGNHPRKFSEKYKEHAPEKYPETLQKVIESGKTPVGTHRPIMVQEILEVLRPQPGAIAVDATLGYGGHATELLKCTQPGGRLIGLDTDPIELPKTEARLSAAGFGNDILTVVQSNFAGLSRILAALGIEGADMILADLGLSSMQIDNPERGFTFKFDGPLDLRMNPNKGRSAADLLSDISVAKLEELLRENADEPRAALLAKLIFEAQEKTSIKTTRQLGEVVRGACGANREEMDATIRRVFQALRIEVNDEFSALETFLRFLPQCLKGGGRVAILTFHSGEDRRVKRFFDEGLRSGEYAEISRSVIRPGPVELRANPRSGPAKLRWAVKGGQKSH